MSFRISKSFPATKPASREGWLGRHLRSIALAGAFVAAVAVPPVQAGALDDAAARFKPYVVEQIGRALAGARALSERVAANDLRGAQQAWLDARVGWERAEIITGEFFPDLDDAIDSWPNAKTGFHAIEAKLFAADLADLEADATALVDNLAAFDQKLRATTLSPQGLLNGAAKVAFEIGENKAGGGESPFSGNSLAEMRDNIAGIKAVYQTVFAPSLKARDPKLGEAAQAQIGAVEALLTVSDLKSLDQARLRTLSEELAVTLQNAAPELGLDKPKLED